MRLDLEEYYKLKEPEIKKWLGVNNIIEDEMFETDYLFASYRWHKGRFQEWICYDGHERDYIWANLIDCEIDDLLKSKREVDE